MTHYEAVHPKAVSENYFLIGDAYNFDKNSNSIYLK